MWCVALLPGVSQAEADLYSKSSQLVHFLGQWKSGQSTIAGRYEELMIELYERAYIEEQVRRCGAYVGRANEHTAMCMCLCAGSRARRQACTCARLQKPVHPASLTQRANARSMLRLYGIAREPIALLRPHHHTVCFALCRMSS